MHYGLDLKKMVSGQLIYFNGVLNIKTVSVYVKYTHTHMILLKCSHVKMRDFQNQWLDLIMF